MRSPHLVLTVPLLVTLAALPLPGRADPAGPQIRSYLQVRATDPAGEDAYYSLRRLKLMFSGEAGAGYGYYGQALYKANNGSGTDCQLFVQELRVWRRRGHTQVTVGQFKPPFGWERFTPDTALAVIDRSPATNHLVPNGALGKSFTRDRGIQVDWTTGGLEWSAGIFDGAGANNDPHGLGPLIAARAAFNRKSLGRGGPRVAHAEAAVSWRHARGLNFAGQLPGSRALGYGDFDGHDWRLDLAAGLRQPRWEVRAEYLRAVYRPSAGSLPDLNAEGYYVQATYRLGTRLEAAAKYDDFATARGYDLHQTTVGLNLYIDGEREKVQLNYLLRGASPGVSAPDAVVCQYQRFF